MTIQRKSLILALFLTALVIFGCVSSSLRAQNRAAPIGIFESHQDVGTVLHAGSVDYDPSRRSYTIVGSGENMWFASDAFQFVWKKVSGDVRLTADIAFAGNGGEPHRKAVLMIRQNLDADSPYADVALHGAGLTSLQSRDSKGATTHEVQAQISAPTRLRIEKRGEEIYMFLGGTGGEPQFSGASMRLALEEPFYVGLGVCSHNKDTVAKAVFSNVDLVALPAAPSGELYSTLETIAVASSDRRVAYVTPGRITAPEWSSDGASLLLHRDGRAEKLPLDGGTPEAAGALPETAEPEQPQVPPDDYNNAYPHLSPDRRMLVFLSYSKEAPAIPEDKPVLLRIMSLPDKKITVLAKLTGGRGTIDRPSWSPDSRRLAFISYHYVAK